MKYRRFGPDEFKTSCGIASHAFYNYEFFTNYIPDRKRLRFLEKLTLCDIRLNAKDTIGFFAVENDRPVASAILYAPHRSHRPSDLAYMTHGFPGVMLAGGPSDVWAWNTMNDKNDAPCNAVTDSWYLNLLTIEPEYQGRGIGSAMLRDCLLPYIREHGGQTLVLVTNSEINRRFYEKNGFTVFHKDAFTYKGRTTPSWSFRLDL